MPPTISGPVGVAGSGMPGPPPTKWAGRPLGCGGATPISLPCWAPIFLGGRAMELCLRHGGGTLQNWLGIMIHFGGGGRVENAALSAQNTTLGARMGNSRRESGLKRWNSGRIRTRTIICRNLHPPSFFLHCAHKLIFLSFPQFLHFLNRSFLSSPPLWKLKFSPFLFQIELLRFLPFFSSIPFTLFQTRQTLCTGWSQKASLKRQTFDIFDC